MVQNDEKFELITTRIFKSLSTAFKQVEDYIGVFEEFRSMFIENNTYVSCITTALSDSPLEVYRDEIEKYKAMTAHFESIPVSCTVGFLEVDSAAMRTRLMPSPLKCLQAIKELLPQLMKKTASQLLDQLGAIIPVISGVASSVEDFVRKKHTVTSAHIGMEDYKTAQKRLQDMAALMIDYKWPLPDSEKAHLVMIEENMTSLETGIQIAESVEEEESKRFAEQIRDETPRLRKKILAVREELDNGMISSLDVQPEKVLAFLSQQSAMLGTHKARATKLAEYQGILGQQVEEYDTLDEVSADLTLKTKLWSGVQEWTELTSSWLTTAFKGIDAAVLEKYVTQYTRMCHQAAKGLPGNAVAKQLKADVDTFAPVLPVVVNLRNDFLKDRHWQIIHDLVGFQILGQDSLTLGDLLEKKVTDYHEDITGVATAAVQEAVLEEMMAKVAATWDKCELEVKPYKDSKDLYILGDVSEIIANLDDSLVTINTVLGSRYVGGIRTLVDTWRGKLVRMQETLDEWIACQRSKYNNSFALSYHISIT
jgi:dynein heavy chain, axonemal